MICFRKHGTHGKLGNQLFQLATFLGFSKKYEAPFAVPAWHYAQFFDSEIPQQVMPAMDLDLQEPQFHYTPEWWDVHANDFKDKNVNITGWLQSYKYFEHCKYDVKRMFKFQPDLVERMRTRFELATVKPTIAISIRRGDYVGNPNYVLLPIKYYLIALLENFPDFRENYNIVIFTDDFNYAKVHFKCLGNVFYAEGLNDIEQLCAGTLCDHFIIANSTFSWWMAWLSEKETTKVIRPSHVFAGELAKTHFLWDHYPENWIVLDHKDKKIDLSNVTFTIPVKFDSKDRMENLDIALKLIQQDFDTNIIVGEQGHHRFKYVEAQCRYVSFEEMEYFHRTKMLNDMAGMCRTSIVVNYDADVVIPPLQIIEAVRLLTTNKADMVYPYDGAFARVPRKAWLSKINEFGDVGMFGNTMFNGMYPHDAKSVGGCIMFNTQAFYTGGMENENFISYGPEDVERYERFQKLGYKIERIDGTLYHFDHILSNDSSMYHQHFNANKKECERIRAMSFDDLKRHVESWPWAKKYMPSYYEAILEESVRSRDAVFKVLEDWGVLKDGHNIIDAGCALGAWGFESKYFYRGIDFNVPREKLVIHHQLYWNDDLRKPLHGIVNKFDLCLALEVGEHLEPEFADQFVDNLCVLSDAILFSAAIPGQGGINHYNEQWQSWWAEKFAVRGYWPCFNDIRKYIWNNEDVGCWYRQNMVLYSKEYVEGNAPRKINDDYELDVVHPQMYLNLMKHYRIMK